MVYLYAMSVSAIDPDDARARALIGPERLIMIDRKSRPQRAQSFAAHLLLSYALRRNYPDVIQPPVLSQTTHGKPFLPSYPNVHFSLSHAGVWALCAVSDHPCGVDIELRAPRRRDIAARFFHPAEVIWLDSLPAAMREDRFYLLWTLKESYVKAVGAGLTMPLRSFAISLNRNNEPTVSCSSIDQPYSLASVPFPADIAYRVGLCVAGNVRLHDAAVEILG